MSHNHRSNSKQRCTNQQSRSITPSTRNRNPRDDIFSKILGSPDLGDDTEDYDDEELDPRVQDELEKLNSCTDDINQLENELEDANCLFRSLLTDSTHQLKALSKKIGGSVIEKARPYYEALEISNKAQKECQAAATAYQRACGIHAAAKETIALAEQRFLSNSNEWEFDNAWQEMLNHATIKVMAAEKQKTESESEHLKRAASFTAAEHEVQRLEKKLQKHIQKSQPYFEHKDILNKALESQKKRVQDLQAKVTGAKTQYSKSLRNLEDISESIHAKRKLRQLWAHNVPAREPGVGAELDFDLDTCDRGSTRSTTSGQSASKASSEWNSIETLQLKPEEEISPKNPLDMNNLSRQLESIASMKTVTRTTSCPAEMPHLQSPIMNGPPSGIFGGFYGRPFQSKREVVGGDDSSPIGHLVESRSQMHR